MKALIQHNFTSGLGDCIVGVYEYLETANTLKKLGYEIDLILNVSTNVYFHDEYFFKLFNEKIFKDFSKIEFTKTPIMSIKHNELTRVYTLSNANPGLHWWDLFINEPDNFKYEWVSIYPYQEIKTPTNIKIFNQKIYNQYQKLKFDYNLTSSFKSIYFRTFDYVDEPELYLKYENQIKEIILNNDKVFVCSNSVKIKDRIKNLDSKKVITFNIPFEKEFGNHWMGKKNNLEPEELFEKSKYTIFDMLTLSDSIDITHISEWGRTSNFLIFSKINNIQIISCYDY
jgi:hypothetical protein